MNDDQVNTDIITALIILAVILLIIIIKLKKKVSSNEEEKKQLLLKLAIADKQIENFRLENLKFQLSPHTIVNSISHLTSFASKTVEGLNGLNAIMSFMLHEGNEQLITLQQEWDFLKAYIKISSLKLSPLVTIKQDFDIYEADNIYHQKLIPPFLTAYFAENAFKHGDTSQDGQFYISMQKKDGKLIYSVKNKVGATHGNQEKSSGIGKKNLSERLKIIYPNQHRIEYISEQGYYTSIIEIDLLRP